MPKLNREPAGSLIMMAFHCGIMLLRNCLSCAVHRIQLQSLTSTTKSTNGNVTQRTLARLCPFFIWLCLSFLPCVFIFLLDVGRGFCHEQETTLLALITLQLLLKYISSKNPWTLNQITENKSRVNVHPVY